jgi:L-alanine-DL-glutamate epimerase-like enolase superfamily enzyme
VICRNDAGSGFDTKPELAPFESRREFAMISLNRDNDRMRITDIRETSIALNSTLKNSSIDFSEMTTSVVAVVTDVKRHGKPVVGYAFNSTGRYACGAQMRARFIPRILKSEPASLLNQAGDNFDAGKILVVMMRNEKSGGHSERSVGIGTIETAVWDVIAKVEEKPLHVVLAERHGGDPRIGKCFVYVGGGWYAPGKGIRELQDEMKRHLDAGYTMVKMKVGGAPLAEDMRRIEAVKSILPPHAELAVDANSKFDLKEALAYAHAMTPYGLRWFEEPCDPLDYATLAEISAAYPGSISTGENLFSMQDVENLVRFGGLKAQRRDVIQVDPPQAYGIAQYSETLAMLQRHGWPRAGNFPHGGNQMSLAIAAGFGLGGAESYPGVFGVFAGFADDAVIENGYISLSDRPGIGFEGQAALYRVMKELAA